MDVLSDRVNVSKTADGETLLFIKSISILFILDSVHHPIHAVGGVLAHFIFNKLAIQPTREFTVKKSPAILQQLSRSADGCFTQLDKTCAEFQESYVQFEIWMEEFEIAIGKKPPKPEVVLPKTDADFDIIGPHSV